MAHDPLGDACQLARQHDARLIIEPLGDGTWRARLSSWHGRGTLGPIRSDATPEEALERLERVVQEVLDAHGYIPWPAETPDPDRS